MLSADYAYVALPTVNNARTPPNSQFHSPSLILLTSLSLSLSLSFSLSLSISWKSNNKANFVASQCGWILCYFLTAPESMLHFFLISFCAYLCCTACGFLAFWLSGLLVCWLLQEGGGRGARHYLTIGSLQLAWLFGHLKHFEWHNLPLIWIIAKPIILALPFSCHCNLIYTRIAPQKVIR